MLAGYAVTVIGTLRVSIYYLSMISWGQSSQKLDLPRPEKYSISASVLLRPATQIIILSWPCTVCKWFMNGNYTDLLFCMNIHSLCLYTQKNGDGLSLSKLIAAVLTKKKCFPQICWHVGSNKKNKICHMVHRNSWITCHSPFKCVMHPIQEVVCKINIFSRSFSTDSTILRGDILKISLKI